MRVHAQYPQSPCVSRPLVCTLRTPGARVPQYPHQPPSLVPKYRSAHSSPTVPPNIPSTRVPEEEIDRFESCWDTCTDQNPSRGPRPPKWSNGPKAARGFKQCRRNWCPNLRPGLATADTPQVRPVLGFFSGPCEPPFGQVKRHPVPRGGQNHRNIFSEENCTSIIRF